MKLEDEITRAELVLKLHALEDRPWLEWGRLKKPISANGVARLLKAYDIRPGNIGSGNEPAHEATAGRSSMTRGAIWGRQYPMTPSHPFQPLKPLRTKGLRRIPTVPA